MAIVINGSGTVTGLAVGGLPDGTVDAGTLATNSVDSAELIDGAIDDSHIAALAASKLSGTVAAARMPAGSVLQVLIVEDASEQALSSATYTDTGLSVSITPSSTSNKILCMWNMHAYNGVTGAGFGVRLIRGSTNVYTSAQAYDTYVSASENRRRSDYKHLDSPSTTSVITYKVQVASYGSKSISLNSEGNQTQLVLMEIAG